MAYNVKHRVIIERISLDCPANQTTVLLGGSGSGKSTVLKMILGLITPKSGLIKFEDKTISEWDKLDLRRRIGYVIQSGGLFPHLTVLANISLVGRFLEKKPEWILSRTSELLDLVNLNESDLIKYPHEMSGGENQRVALMRALFLDPEVLLFDEPLSALDPITRSDLQKDLKQIFNKLKKTVVLVTHDLYEASFFGQSLILLNDGKIEQNGSVEDFLKNPKTEFSKKFINAQNHGRSF